VRGKETHYNPTPQTVRGKGTHSNPASQTVRGKGTHSNPALQTVRGKGTHSNPAPQRGQNPITSTSLSLDETKYRVTVLKGKHNLFQEKQVLEIAVPRLK